MSGVLATFQRACDPCDRDPNDLLCDTFRSLCLVPSTELSKELTLDPSLLEKEDFDNQTLLHHLCNNTSLKYPGVLVEQALKAGASVTARDRFGRTPLETAITRIDDRCILDSTMPRVLEAIKPDDVEVLFAANPDTGKTILHTAAEHFYEYGYEERSCMPQLIELIKKLAPNELQRLLSQPDAIGLTPIDYALKARNRDALAALLKEGVQLPQRTAEEIDQLALRIRNLQSRPLRDEEGLAMQRQLDMAEGFDEKIYAFHDLFKKTAPGEAIDFLRIRLREFIRTVSDEMINLQGRIDGYTLLHLLVLAGDLVGVQELTGRGARGDIQKNGGGTAIDLSLINKHTEIYQHLKACGYSWTTTLGVPELVMVSTNTSAKIAEDLLQQYGVTDFTKRYTLNSCTTITQLSYAFQHGDFSWALYLVQRGADLKQVVLEKYSLDAE